MRQSASPFVPRRGASTEAEDIAQDRRYQRTIVQVGHTRHLVCMMAKRIIATFLWFYSGLLVGSFAVFVLSLPSVLALLVAVLAATFVALDPMGLFWTRPAKTKPSTAVMEPILSGVGLTNPRDGELQGAE